MPGRAHGAGHACTAVPRELRRQHQHADDHVADQYADQQGTPDLDRAPASAVASFAGVGNPHLRADIQDGETVLDLGSGAGLDGIIASWRAGPGGRVIGVDLNPSMCLKAQANAAATGSAMECQPGRMEDIPLPDESVDVVISNGVINLSFRKRRVVEEIFRVLRPGGRISITDIVSGKQLSQNIVNDPNLWAS
jgi:arsenite methyltransferase